MRGGLLALIGLPLGFAAPALAAPKWGIKITPQNVYEEHGASDPFDPVLGGFDLESGENRFLVTVTNVAPNEAGNAVPAKAHVTVTDTLPPGLMFVERGGAGPWNCQTGVGAKTVTCEKSAPTELEPGDSYPALIVAGVYVTPEAAAEVEDTATVEGGGGSVETGHASTAINTVPFGIHEFTQKDENEALEPETQAGGHPFLLDTNFEFNFVPGPTNGHLFAAGGGAGQLAPKELETELPPGLIGDVQHAKQCPLAVFNSRVVSSCPPESKVGFISVAYAVSLSPSGQPELFCGPPETPTECANNTISPIYNLTPSYGHPAEFGLQIFGTPFILYAKVRSDGNYGASVGDENTGPTLGAKATFCGYGVLSVSLNPGEIGTCNPRPAQGAEPFLTNPTQCLAEPEPTVLRATAWDDPAKMVSAEVKLPFTGCESLDEAFVGSIARIEEGKTGSKAEETKTGSQGQAENRSPGSVLEFEPQGVAAGADQPVAMNLKLAPPREVEAEEKEVEGEKKHFIREFKIENGHGEQQEVSPPALKNLTMKLPPGLTLSSASAAAGRSEGEGLHACTNTQFGLGSTTEPAPEAHCPLTSQIGTVEVFTPLLEKGPHGGAPLTGALYVAQPECSPCGAANAQNGTLFRLFLQLVDRQAGVVVKLHGTASVNPATGEVTTSFERQPQLPFERFVVHLSGGPRAPLATSEACGTYTTTGEVTPWSSKEVSSSEVAHTASSFAVGCPSSFPFEPELQAGTEYPGAGHYSSFSLTVAPGPHGEQEQGIQNLEVHMPPGLTAKIANVPTCPEPAANEGTCGTAKPESHIGTTTVLVGSGSHPFSQQGNIYLTGGYEGAPFGLSIVVPAVAGPYNLGEVVARSAVRIDENTAAVTVNSTHSIVIGPGGASAPIPGLPTILDGIPLRVRKLNVTINRNEFELNPTTCSAQTITGTITSSRGVARGASSHFDVGACGALAFAPAFSASTEAKTSRTEGAALTVTINQKLGESNIKRVNVQLPGALPSRLTTLQHACTAAQFNLNPKGCPEQSFVGTATAKTPILRSELKGPAILVARGAEFPDLDFLLEGEGIKIDVVGATEIKKGITYSKFEAVPDQPIESFTTSFPRGPHSILAANGNLCTQKLEMPTTIEGQNGGLHTQTTTVSVLRVPEGRHDEQADKGAQGLPQEGQGPQEAPGRLRTQGAQALRQEGEEVERGRDAVAGARRDRGRS